MLQGLTAQLLDSHNRLRRSHGAPSLKLSDELTRLAQGRAEQLARRDSEDPGCCGAGENLFARVVRDGEEVIGEEVTQCWHRNVLGCNWRGSDGQTNCHRTCMCSNSTQLIWASITEVGFGWAAAASSGRLHVVARYQPAGNCSGGFHGNVVLLPRDTNLLVSSCGGGGSSSSRIHSLPLANQSAINVVEEMALANTLNSNAAASRRFAAQLLVAHNEYRALHQAPPLRLNDELARLAQAWADILATTDSLAYDLKCDRQGIGENVARKCDVKSSDASAQEFVDTWYSEANSFDWRSLEDQFSCSHFAQLVWRSSREAGFGRATSASGCVYVVGRYRPRGNISGEFPRNVLPRLTKKRASDQAPVESAKKDGAASASSSKTFTKMINKLLPPKRLQMDAAAPPPTTQPSRTPSPNGPELTRHQPRSSTAAPSTSQAGPLPSAKSAASNPAQSVARDGRDRGAPPPTPAAPGGAPAAPAASPAASPMSAKSLFSSLAFKEKAAAPPSQTPGPLASTKGLFMSLSAPKSPAGSGSPMTANILRHMGSHPRDGRESQMEPQEEAVPEFSMRKFTMQLLVSHNEYRAQHKSPPLRVNGDLCRLAQDWADVLAQKDRMAHDPNCAVVRTGENVAMKFRIGETNFPGDVFTELWYDEVEAYDWTSEELQPECGHFTQLVWKSTTEVGFGRAVSDTGRVYVVGRYRPPGNYRGEFKRNVLPAEDEAAAQQPAQEPLPQPPTMGFAVREFGPAKRRSVVFNEAEMPRTPGGMPTRALHEFLPLKSALKLPGASAQPANEDGGGSGGGGGGGGGPASVSPMSAMLLRRTLQQGHTRPPEKKVAKPEETFSQKKFESQMLVSHNEYRALHRAPPLRLNGELSSLAQVWAEVLAGKDKMAHDPKCGALGLGENVAMKFRKGFTTFPGDIFTELWYHEIDQYRWTGEDQLACGHFTQLVWRTSTEVGFGRAVAKSGRVYVVGRYKPPGNYSGQFGRNVLPPTRVMPRSRNNPAGAEKQPDDAPQKSETSAPAPASAPAESVEYAGFGTSRVVESRRGLAMASRRPVAVAAASVAPATGAAAGQQKKSTPADPSVQSRSGS